jgi:LPXTG-motif cell wall-anchored protein
MKLLHATSTRRAAFGMLLALSLLLSPARPAAAVGNDVGYMIGFMAQEAAVDVPTPFMVMIANEATSTAGADVSISVEANDPSILTMTYVGTDCDTAQATNSTVVVQHLVPPGERCTAEFAVIFNKPGSYTAADFTVDAEVTGPDSPSFVVVERYLTVTVLPAPSTEPAVCELTPDLAVSPELIDLAPGGTAVIELAMRNLCKDVPTPSGDLLLSLSDGISVVETSSGMTNLDSRAAVQNFTLLPDETRRWTVTVTAAEALVAAPQHVTEYYTGGRVMSRIDGVFITPAPAPAAESAVVAESTAPAAEAPLPAALPNTAGEQSALPVTAALPILAVAAAAFLFSRRKAVR